MLGVASRCRGRGCAFPELKALRTEQYTPRRTHFGMSVNVAMAIRLFAPRFAIVMASHTQQIRNLQLLLPGDEPVESCILHVLHVIEVQPPVIVPAASHVHVHIHIHAHAVHIPKIQVWKAAHIGIHIARYVVPCVHAHVRQV